MMRFDIKSLLWSITLIGLGLGALYVVSSPSNSWPRLYRVLPLLSIGPLIGTGLLLPIGRAWIGFALGLLAMALRQSILIHLSFGHQTGACVVAVVLWLSSALSLLFAWWHYAAKNSLPSAD